jgi:hypothetical protein
MSVLKTPAETVARAQMVEVMARRKIRVQRMALAARLVFLVHPKRAALRMAHRIRVKAPRQPHSQHRATALRAVRTKRQRETGRKPYRTSWRLARETYRLPNWRMH